MSTALDITIEEAGELLTEGGNDAGVDGLRIGEVDDGEFTVFLFQGKYKKDLNVESNFPENGVMKAVSTIGTLFDPDKKIELNKFIAPKVEEIRSLVRDGNIPNVRMVLCNNGAKWNAQAQNWINQSGFRDDQVQWIHWNHDSIVSVLKKLTVVDESLQLKGKAIIEEFSFRRVLVGKVSVTEIATLFKRHGDLLLQRNIRRYLGLHSNRVNSAIHETLTNEQKRANFYFLNNGITMICSKFRNSTLQGENYQVKLDGLQIVNGGQTCKTIQQTLDNPDLFAQSGDIHVMVRIYELADEDKDFVKDITYATNSQNPVDLRDLHSNDDIQRQLEIGIRDMGFTYKRQQDESVGAGSSVITSATVAESVLAIWRRQPHTAKYRRKEHFGHLYDIIFKDLNAAQALLAVHIFRYVENQRKRPESANPPDFLPYASHYIAMIVGMLLTIKAPNITHQNYKELATHFETNKSELYDKAIQLLESALNRLYGNRSGTGGFPLSLQQLSATFRRGDLLVYIDFSK